ncbi:MAG: prephenate dehydrogenase/arogenate dehydrogenase family protein [archaeon]|nr:prephenate dehydrogenase/arogenate dehydrogenase family protein [archaeon]MCP8319979.1 prephenate dehydrogenase/arogenate dehydrogenase family protein [archaeon]
MRVAIIGGAGRMGRWFARYFKSKDHTVIISDIEEKARTIAEKEGFLFAKSNVDAVKDADLIMISVSIESTPKVIKEIEQNLIKGAIVTEISSIKSHVTDALADLAQKDVTALSIHPLFGSGARTLKGKKIAVIPVKDSKKEVNLVQKFFPEAIIDVINAEEHDRIMALTLSLPHFLNMVFASTLSDEDINNLRRFAGPSFTLQLILAESMLTEKPNIYASIQIMNKHTYQCLEKLMNEAKALKEIIRKNKRKELISFFEQIRENFLKDIEAIKPYEKLYEIVERLEP